MERLHRPCVSTYAALVDYGFDKHWSDVLFSLLNFDHEIFRCEEQEEGNLLREKLLCRLLIAWNLVLIDNHPSSIVKFTVSMGHNSLDYKKLVSICSVHAVGKCDLGISFVQDVVGPWLGSRTQSITVGTRSPATNTKLAGIFIFLPTDLHRNLKRLMKQFQYGAALLLKLFCPV